MMAMMMLMVMPMLINGVGDDGDGGDDDDGEDGDGGDDDSVKIANALKIRCIQCPSPRFAFFPKKTVRPQHR